MSKHFWVVKIGPDKYNFYQMYKKIESPSCFPEKWTFEECPSHMLNKISYEWSSRFFNADLMKQDSV